jgi:hypothetical protein
MAIELDNKLKSIDIAEVLATRARSIFSHRINFDVIDYHHLSEMKQWCEDNCKGIWRCEHFHALYFQFEDDYDATMFMLRWGTAEGNKLK